jgi:hypothetical protein
MALIQEFGYSVKVGMEEAHQRWMEKNEKRLAAAHPAGTRYIGTYVVVFSSDKQSGSYRSLIELDSYAAIDRMAAAMKDPKGKLGKLMREWSAFGDYDWNAGWSQGLFRSVVDATIWDPAAEA